MKKYETNAKVLPMLLAGQPIPTWVQPGDEAGDDRSMDDWKNCKDADGAGSMRRPTRLPDCAGLSFRHRSVVYLGRPTWKWA